MNWGKRTASLLLAAGIGVLSPAGSLPAWAQESTTPSPTPTPSQAQSDVPSWAPPPVSVQVPEDSGKPPESYEPKNQCVSKNLGVNIELVNKPWGQQYLQIEELHKIVQAKTKAEAGEGIKVAVIDTGVRAHRYFQDRVEGGGDYVITEDKGLKDCDGHGTEVAGIIAANPKNTGIGFIGVAPAARILSIRQSSQNYKKQDKTSSATSSSSSETPGGGQSKTETPSGENSGGDTGGQSFHGDTQPNQKNTGRQQGEEGSAGTLKSLAQAVVRAANAPGVKVMNLSVDNCRPAAAAMGEGEKQLQAAVKYAVEVKNVVVVAAAGNTGDNCKQNDQPNPEKPTSIVTPPWFSNDVISVGAIHKDGSVAPFSVFGPWVTVAAPGTEIISLDPAPESDGLANLTIEGGNEPSQIQGTSFAAPYVAGVVALVRQMYPDLDARGVMKRITETAQHPAAPGGRDNFVGYGVINPMAALTSSLPSERGVKAPVPVRFPADLPPANNANWKPMVVALAGAGGGLVALLITLFVVHTVRRNRSENS
ncbi:membrane-anchored mycosin MYCP [Amycolatopsis xylanica]|uniref:Membrane-anchored mycosin MYCP n=1 Tax=Amycolatopsis xylanica TaxID=589385 RepID=A0A1H3LJU7_9PSEU|nr:S8 family serine peptidase [Amycolatopsis xylanica]SDY64671.1 membrane-anchored mycosin MYCP [Amycolatopsis xylanica]